MTEHRIQTEYWHGDIVYLKCDKSADAGMVTDVRVMRADTGLQIMYGITWHTGGTSGHYGYELTDQPYPKEL